MSATADSAPESVGPEPQNEPQPEMSVIGLGMVPALLLLLLPLLPFIAIVWGIGKLLDYGT
jgi:hypothetical protein